ncbi:MAG: MarR family winged helix-turn-helix transcriptional regulator [Mycobacteriaceae bacterium]
MSTTDTDSGTEAATTTGHVSAHVSAHVLGDELLRMLKTMERTSAHVAARRHDVVDKAAFAVLFRLLHDGPQRSGALAEAMLTDPSTVSRHVAQLVDLGLVERTADPADGRATVLAVTERGHRTARDMRTRRNAIISAVVADWTDTDIGVLSQLMARFTGDLERHRPHILAECDAQPSIAPSRSEGAS